MNKEEILYLNKQDNQRFDERQKNGIVVACNKAYRISRFLCAIVVALDCIVLKHINLSVLSIFMIMNGVYLFYMYKTSTKKVELVFSIIYIITSILLFIKYLLEILW